MPVEPRQGEISYKGVVFNEMKGVYSSPDSVFYRAVQQVGKGGMWLCSASVLERACACVKGWTMGVL